MKYFLARLYQKILYIFTCLIKFREPIILNNTDELVNVLKKKSVQNILLLSVPQIQRKQIG